MKPLLIAAMSVCALALMGPALATCPELTPKSCSVDSYLKVLRDDPCGKCVPSSSPPDPAEIECHRAGNNYYCEVWPKGPELTYTWNYGGSVTLQIPGTTASTLQAIYCNGIGTGGWVQLTVTSPFGIPASTTLGVECDVTHFPGY